MTIMIADDVVMMNGEDDLINVINLNLQMDAASSDFILDWCSKAVSELLSTQRSESRWLEEIQYRNSCESINEFFRSTNNAN